MAQIPAVPRAGGPRELPGLEGETPLRHRRGQRRAESALHVGERHPVLRSLRTRQARLHGTQVEFQHVGVFRVRGFIGAEEALALGVRLDAVHFLFGAAGAPQVRQGLGVHRKETHRRAVFRRHVRHRGAVGERNLGEPLAEELHEALDHPVAPQALGDREHEVGRGDALAEGAAHTETDHLRGDEVTGLAEHGRFGLDASHAPAQDAEAVDHRGVGVGPDEGVREEHAFVALAVFHHHLGEELEVHLVDDAGGGRNDPEAGERFLPPAKEPVALLVPFELDRRVLPGRHRGAEGIHHHRVVNDQVHRRLRVDPRRVAAHPGERGPHGGEVHERGNPREILQDHPRRAERNLAPGGRLGIPGREGGHVLFADRPSVHPAEQRLKQHPDRERKPGNGPESFPLHRFEGEDVRIAAGGAVFFQRSEGVM